jgi:uncharacterized protein (DUF433 family)
MKTQKRKPRKSAALTVRLEEQQMLRLSRLARCLSVTPSETGGRLIEEGLRRAEFAYIDFRSSRLGRQAMITGTRLSVPQVIMIARDYDYDVDKTAEHLGWATFKVDAAFNYWNAFREEVEATIEDIESVSLQDLKNLLPQLEGHEYTQAPHGTLIVKEDKAKPNTTKQQSRAKSKPRKRGRED